MYLLAKILQAAGLTIMGIGFIAQFPRLMDHTLLGLSIGLFGCGWGIQKFLVHH